jgi:hypothetical protein
MKHTVFLTTLLASVLLLSACSTREDFVVLNKSGGVVEVRYKLKRCTPETPGKYVDTNPPAKLRVEEFQKSDHVWTALPKEQYKYDGLTCTFTVNVSPNEVLLVGYTYNYQGHDSESSELHFRFDNLLIMGSKGTVRLEGRQAQTQFIKIESGDYAITYR